MMAQAMFLRDGGQSQDQRYPWPPPRRLLLVHRDVSLRAISARQRWLASICANRSKSPRRHRPRTALVDLPPRLRAFGLARNPANSSVFLFFVMVSISYPLERCCFALILRREGESAKLSLSVSRDQRGGRRWRGCQAASFARRFSINSRRRASAAGISIKTRRNAPGRATASRAR